MTLRPRRASLRVGGVARRAVWAIADQGLSSLTNFGLGVVVARAVSPETFGAFSIAFAAYALVLNLANGAISEPFQVRFSDASIEVWREATKQATGTAVSAGLVGGAVCGLVALGAGGTVRQAFFALSLTLPILTLQDAWRATFFARRKGSCSFLNDLVWALTLVPALIVASRMRPGSLFWLILAWGIAAGVAAVFGGIQAGAVPSPRLTARWLQRQRDLAPRYMGEMLLYSGGHQLAVLAIGVVGGLAVVGGIRGAEMLLGPLYVFIFGVRIMAVPEAVLLLKRSASKMRRALALLAVGFTTVAVMVGAGALVIPEHWGTSLLGRTWITARPAMFPIAVFMAASGASMSARIGLRALGDSRRGLMARLYTMPLVVAFGTFGAAIGGSREAAWGLAIGMAVDVACSWQQLDRALRSTAEEGIAE